MAFDSGILPEVDNGNFQSGTFDLVIAEISTSGLVPEEFAILRRLLESRMGKRGKREFVQVLRLMENFRKQEIHRPIRDALRMGAVSFGAVRHLLPRNIEGRPPRLDMELYPYLPRV